MLKATLIAIAALTAFDALAWQGQYRVRLIQELGDIAAIVTGQDWTSGPLA